MSLLAKHCSRQRSTKQRGDGKGFPREESRHDIMEATARDIMPSSFSPWQNVVRDEHAPEPGITSRTLYTRHITPALLVPPLRRTHWLNRTELSFISGRFQF